jgi:hypothetical protein
MGNENKPVNNNASFLDAIEVEVQADPNAAKPAIEPVVEKTPVTQEEEVIDEEVVETPEEIPADDEEEVADLPDSAPPKQKSAFAKLRKALQTERQEKENLKKAVISDDDRKELDYYKTNKNVVDRSLQVYEYVQGWSKSPEVAAKQFAGEFPEAATIIMQQAEAVKTPPAAPAPSVSTLSDEDWDELEEVSPEATKIFKKLSSSWESKFNSMQKELDTKNQELASKTTELDTKLNQTEAQKQQEIKNQKALEVQRVRDGWRTEVEATLTGYDVGPKAAQTVYRDVMSNIEADYTAGKFGDPSKTYVKDIVPVIKLADYINQSIEELRLPKKAATDPTKDTSKPTNTRTQLTKPGQPAKPAEKEIKTSTDLLDFVAGQM